VVALIWGNQIRVFRNGLDNVRQWGSLSLTDTQITAAIVSLGAIALFYFWLHYSHLGLEFRALADNPKEFALQGYDVSQLRLVAFGISGLLGGISSLLVAYDVGFDPTGGLSTDIIL
jgi:branched-chain amino acid transport system permease protein